MKCIILLQYQNSGHDNCECNGESSGVNRHLEEEAHYLETEYNNTLSGNYKLVQDYGSTSDVDKE